MRPLLVLILLTLSLSACGQKGGLYIPQDEPAPTENQAEPGK